MFDPLSEYLQPQLQGYRLDNGVYRPLPIADDGGITSPALSARLLPAGEYLRAFRLATSEEILEVWSTPQVALSQLREAEARAQAEAERAEAAEQRVAELERRLRERESR